MPTLQKIGSHKTTVSHLLLGPKPSTVITYHETPVVIFDEDSIALNTGGWNTVTTRNRMNQASNQFNLGFRVFQKRGELFCNYLGQDLPFNGQDRMYLTRP